MRWVWFVSANQLVCSPNNKSIDDKCGQWVNCCVWECCVLPTDTSECDACRPWWNRFLDNHSIETCANALAGIIFLMERSISNGTQVWMEIEHLIELLCPRDHRTLSPFIHPAISAALLLMSNTRLASPELLPLSADQLNASQSKTVQSSYSRRHYLLQFWKNMVRMTVESIPVCSPPLIIISLANPSRCNRNTIRFGVWTWWPVNKWYKTFAFLFSQSNHQQEEQQILILQPDQRVVIQCLLLAVTCASHLSIAENATD